MSLGLSASEPRSRSVDSGAPGRAWEQLIEARLRDSQAQEAAWAQALRQEARSEWKGWPSRKQEGWRFLSVRTLAETAFAEARVDEAEAQALVQAFESSFPGEGEYRIYLVGDRLCFGEGLPEGVALCALSSLTQRDEAEPTFSSPSDSLARLNTLLFREGLSLQVEAGREVALPIHLVQLAALSAKPLVFSPRVRLRLGRGTKLRFIETHWTLGANDENADSATGTRLSLTQLRNGVTQIEVGENACLEHFAQVRAAEGEGVFISTQVEQAGQSLYRAAHLVLGAAPARLDVQVRLRGEEAECEVAGLCAAKGQRSSHAHLYVEHIAPRCRSALRFRGIASERATCTFDGITRVWPAASKSEASQESHNLLLSEQATIHSKPHLEIETDEVSCSHGSTVGSLDEEQLFYLASRGIEADRARAILTWAFAQAPLSSASWLPFFPKIAQEAASFLGHEGEESA